MLSKTNNLGIVITVATRMIRRFRDHTARAVEYLKSVRLISYGINSCKSLHIVWPIDVFGVSVVDQIRGAVQASDAVVGDLLLRTRRVCGDVGQRGLDPRNATKVIVVSGTRGI